MNDTRFAAAAAALTLGLSACAKSDTETTTGDPAAADEPQNAETEAGEQEEGQPAAEADEPRLEPATGSHQAGPLTVSATLCDTGGQKFTASSSGDAIKALAADGDHLYVADSDNRVLRFTADTSSGCTLKLDEAWGEDGAFQSSARIKTLAVAGGKLVIGGFPFQGEVVDIESGARYECDYTGGLIPDPNGDRALGLPSNGLPALVTFGETNCQSTEPAPFTSGWPFEKVDKALWTDDGFVVGGTLAGNNKKLIAFDASGETRWEQGADGPSDPDRYGWFHGIAPCGDDLLCVADTNYNRMQLVGADGEWKTGAKFADLIGHASGSWGDLASDGRGNVWLPWGAKHKDADLAFGSLFLLAVQSR